MTSSPVGYPQTTVETSDDDAIDVRVVVNFVRRRFAVLLSVTAAVFLMALVALVMITPRYTATTQILLDRSKVNIVKMDQVASDTVLDSPGVDTEVQLMQSRGVAERVAASLNLEQDPEFNANLEKPGPMDRFKALVTGEAPPAPRVTKDVPPATREAVIRKLLDNIKVRRVGLTYTIDLTYTSTSPKNASRIANAFAQQYLLGQLGAKSSATEQASGWLESRVNQLRAQLEEAERAVQAYRAANGLFDAAGNQTLTQQEISSLNGQLASARANQAEAEARLNTARRQLASGSTGEDVGEALSSGVVSNLRSQRAEVSRKLSDLQVRYGPRHPELVAAQRQLADIDSQIQAEIRRVISNLDAQAQVARQRTGSLQGSLGASRGTLQANSAAGVRLGELERNAESVRTLYQTFLDRYRETTAQQGVQTSDTRIIAAATEPRSAAFPKANLFLAGGLALGLLLAIAAAVVLELLEQSLSTSADVERWLRTPSVGSIPDLPSTLEKASAAERKQWPPDYVLDKPMSSFAEAFRSVRAAIMTGRGGDQIKVLALTSAIPGEGKTTTSLCLARTLAAGGLKVIVVDCDLRRRSINRILPLPPKVGLVEVLQRKIGWRHAVQVDERSGAVFLPISDAPLDGSNVFDLPTMDALLAELRNEFDLVILDTAPVLAIAETRTLATKADAVLFLVRWRKTAMQASNAAIRQLEAVGAVVAGVALTQVDVREQARSGYGDAGYHYKAYKSYYAQ
jgi:exopolysaccharide transport family protein